MGMNSLSPLGSLLVGGMVGMGEAYWEMVSERGRGETELAWGKGMIWGRGEEAGEEGEERDRREGSECSCMHQWKTAAHCFFATPNSVQK